MIIKDYKTIFVHIPKNAGTSIETFFKKDTYTFDERMFNRHDTIKEIRWKLECNDKFKKSKEYIDIIQNRMMFLVKRKEINSN